MHKRKLWCSARHILRSIWHTIRYKITHVSLLCEMLAHSVRRKNIFLSIHNGVDGRVTNIQVSCFFTSQSHIHHKKAHGVNSFIEPYNNYWITTISFRSSTYPVVLGLEPSFYHLIHFFYSACAGKNYVFGGLVYFISIYVFLIRFNMTFNMIFCSD